jgi:hypothetical protein
MAAALYCSNSGAATTSELFTIDPATGLNVTDQGPLGVALTGLAIDSSGNAFGVTSNNSTMPHTFGSVDLTTGAFTSIHDYGSSGQNLNDICFDGSDVLWGIRQDARLVTIDPATGLTTLIGNTGLGAISGGGLTFSAGGTLFLVTYVSGDKLYSLDTSTAAPTLIGLTGVPNSIGAMATSPDTNVIYGVTPFNGSFWTVDIGTGAATLVGTTTIPQPDGLAFGPAAATGPFRLAASPSSVSVVQGGSTTTTITSTLLSGSPEPISLTVTSVLPTGATATFTPSTISDDGGTSTLRLAATGATPLGTYVVTVHGDDGSGGTANVGVSLHVIAPPPAVANITS